MDYFHERGVAYFSLRGRRRGLCLSSQTWCRQAPSGLLFFVFSYIYLRRMPQWYFRRPYDVLHIEICWPILIEVSFADFRQKKPFSENEINSHVINPHVIFGNVLDWDDGRIREKKILLILTTKGSKRVRNDLREKFRLFLRWKGCDGSWKRIWDEKRAFELFRRPFSF